jgi:hypothetical protein
MALEPVSRMMTWELPFVPLVFGLDLQTGAAQLVDVAGKAETSRKVERSQSPCSSIEKQSKRPQCAA